MALNWRTSGDTTFAAWDALLPAASQIKRRGESRTCYEAAQPFSRLCLGMLRAESSYATDFAAVGPEMNNPLNLKKVDGTGFVRFTSIAECILTWKVRITSPTYKGGVYADTITVADLIHVYAPSSDNNDEAAYVRTVETVINSLPVLTTEPPKEGPTMSITFGRVPHPPFVDLIVNNRFWNDLGQRRPIGVCQHSMVGTLRGSYDYINTGSGQALWDYSVGGATDGANDGVIWRHNDPRGRRAGWANGGSDGLEGDGPLFVRTLGVDAINRDLVSIERSDGGNYQSQPISPKQFESIAQLTAYWFDQARVPWDQYPLNPNVGCVTHMIHKEFATKDCPFPPVYNEINRLQDRVRAILKAAQTAAVDAGNELPPAKPIEQDHERYPNGWKPADLKKQWGVLPRINPGGSITRLHFAVTKNPIAAIANTWVQRGAADGITKIGDLPKPQVWQVIQVDEDTKSDLITFEGGRDAWMLFRPHTRVPWTWIDERALKAKAA